MTLTARPRGRRPATSREQICEVAIELFIHAGYAETSIGDITSACGISKTSFFRYYCSKSEIIWGAVEQHTERLQRRLLNSDPDAPLMLVIRQSLVETLREDVDRQGLWIKRLVVLDNNNDLRAAESAHWISWSRAVTEFVAIRTGRQVTEIIPSAVGGAMQSAFIARLRGWQPLASQAQSVLDQLELDLVPLCNLLQDWIDSPPPAAGS